MCDGSDYVSFCHYGDLSWWDLLQDRKVDGINHLKESFDNKWIPEPNSGCWLWVAGSCSLQPGSSGRYGAFYVPSEKRNIGAHRVSWLLYRGELPNKAVVCHKCDTPSCVNPEHLFLGSHRDNTRDCMNKGRATAWRSFDSKGERNPNAKLSNRQVLEIRSLGGKFSKKELAERFCVTPSNIYLILTGRSRSVDP